MFSASPPCRRSSRRASSSAPACSSSPGSRSPRSCSTAAFGGTRGEDPARIVARVTLVAIALVAALGTATAVGFAAAIGGGTAEAVIGIAAGLGLIAAGLLGGPRWLILPVMVLVLPLAVVSAANIDLTGGVGHRSDHRLPAAPDYRLGMGQMDIDLRDVKLPAGETAVDVSLGIGEARLRVPAGACVNTDASDRPRRRRRARALALGRRHQGRRAPAPRRR